MLAVRKVVNGLIFYYDPVTYHVYYIGESQESEEKDNNANI